MQQVFVPENGDRSGVQNVAIFITAGEFNVRMEETIALATTARLRGICLAAVGVTVEVDSAELYAMVGLSNMLVLVDNFDDLPQALPDILDNVCGK